MIICRWGENNTRYSNNIVHYVLYRQLKTMIFKCCWNLPFLASRNSLYFIVINVMEYILNFISNLIFELVPIQYSNYILHIIIFFFEFAMTLIVIFLDRIDFSSSCIHKLEIIVGSIMAVIANILDFILL